MKKLDKLDKYVVQPNLGFYGGFRWTGEDIFLCEDHDTDVDYDFTVKQTIENGVLITDLKREYTVRERKVTEESHQEVGLKDGELLVYVEGAGYQIPEYKLCKVEDAMEQFNILRGEADDTRGYEEEGTCSN